MIALASVTIELGSRKILDRLDLAVSRGERVAISGESGSGKTTLLKTLIGQYRVEKGRITIDGKALIPQNLTAIRTHLYYLPQEIRPKGDETVRDYLTVPFGFAVNKNRKFDEEAASQLLHRLRLDPNMMAQRLGDLSGGERRRIGLMRGLLLKRPLMLIDELTSAVDERNRRNLVDLLLDTPGVTVIATVHDTDFMQRANRHFILKNGQLKEERA